jgi:hypothetical protein
MHVIRKDDIRQEGGFPSHFATFDRYFLFTLRFNLTITKNKLIMTRFLSFSFLAALVGLGLAGCYPAGPDYTEDLDVVYSNYDPQFDFASRNTYAMPDQIVTDVQITNSGDTIYEYMKPAYADQILTRIASNMSALGWTRVDIEGSTKPDVLLTPAAVSSTTYFYSYWYDWWYGGYYGWGWYYPPYYTVSSYTTGSLIMVIADPNIDSPINSSPAAWVGVLNGLLSGSGNVNRALTGIDQAFEQSPYLKTN